GCRGRVPDLRANRRAPRLPGENALKSAGADHLYAGLLLLPRCGHGLFPWDQAIGLTPKRLTPAAEQVVTLAGAVSNSFAEAADKVLPELAGLRLSASTARRTTTAAGDRLGELWESGALLGFPKPWPWHQDAQGKRCAYISIDATGVRQQGPGGTK